MKKQKSEGTEEVASNKSPSVQQPLSSFFDKGKDGKIVEGSPIIKRGSGAVYDDFQDGKCDIWSWNINGLNACVNKETIQKFIADKDPTVLCLNETKIQTQHIDEKQYYSKFPNGYD